MNTSPPSLSSVRSLLECYLRAKDLNQPELISECFASDAELTFSIATDDIDFPRRVARRTGDRQDAGRGLRRSL